MSDPLSSNLPYPLLVHANTGTPVPPLSADALASRTSDLPGAGQRIAQSTHLGTDGSVEPNDLTQVGWGILFPSDADPAIQAQLQPLIDKRRQDVQDPNLHKVFSGTTGVQPGQTAENWTRLRGVSLTAPVDPTQGIPYYMLIVGSPERISFEFQALLKMQWAVGRIHFDDIEDYGRYAQAVVQYESANPAPRKSAAVWVTRNSGDLATAQLSGAISQSFLAPANMLGARWQFSLNAFTSDKATKAQLIEILRGNLPGGPPSVIFTGSHGCNYEATDPAQRRLQGMLVTQEWKPGSPVDGTSGFSADDVPADARLQGTVGFLFACYSVGCPAQDSYKFNPDGSPITIAPAPFVARLPQALLSHGMLALIGHVDMAFASALIDTNGTPEPQVIRTPLDLLMRGKRIGLAADALTTMWSSRTAQLAMAQNLPAAAIAQMTIARDDARNYMVLGDPAVQLFSDKSQ